ncbi:hypothetical protein TMS3_0107000 [Pseudomonas taeanensis MS-3]|jgi:hypothetical protein|uniref:Uncharacterized protein n=1 Tax=Pseudomonas taeanensis MS-3 TaxID=1395571 RepID=A0A0A1YP23_9PSED|nr:hypothetical protein [Pseudomonas taeanensis]KFX71665.1 hypothetical protein TMS3_0107000 [Pseudomonas taeanensis MS-3]
MTDEIFAYLLPEYINEITELAAKQDWITHNFNTENASETYNPANYLNNIELEKTTYILHLDLNIYQFLLNGARKGGDNEQYRAAAALITFCQIANIEVDPTYPAYEKLNHNEEKLSEVLSDLELFHRINNSRPNQLAKYALGHSEKILTDSQYSLNKIRVGHELTKYKKLKEWDSLYLMILCITRIDTSNTPRHKKLEEFVKWTILKFRKSLVAITYAAVLFSNRPLKRMMKYKFSHSKVEKKNHITNMTWDLYIMDQYFKSWIKKDTSEFLFASADKAFCNLLRLAVNIQKTQNLDPLKEYLPDDNWEKLNQSLNQSNIDTTPNRAYNSEHWGHQYRQKLIEDLENQLF